MSNPILKYLFKAEYKDGTNYLQNPEDKSITEPETRSCFYDVDKDNVSRFTLSSDKDTFVVDLSDGHFEVNGVPFYMHEHRELTDIRLIFFRQHTHSFNAQTKEELSHDVVYRFGFQANDFDGKNIQRVMEIL